MRALVALIVTCAAGTAFAQPKAKAVETTCDVIEVSASNAKDPSIRDSAARALKNL